MLGASCPAGAELSRHSALGVKGKEAAARDMPTPSFVPMIVPQIGPMNIYASCLDLLHPSFAISGTDSVPRTMGSVHLVSAYCVPGMTL